MYHLSCTDINRLVNACKLYQEHTGSEWMWEQYDALIGKLNNYSEQNLVECDIHGRNDTTIP